MCVADSGFELQADWKFWALYNKSGHPRKCLNIHMYTPITAKYLMMVQPSRVKVSSEMWLESHSPSAHCLLLLSVWRCTLDLSWNPFSCGGLYLSDQWLVDRLRGQQCTQSRQFLIVLAL
ncbi:unnamed protein product [Coregonus sp. 'balchen']|nr:unnamed protein product [Coregonus sp. 'balchen']